MPYFDKELFEHLVRETTTQPPQVWTELQIARKKQADDRINAIKKLLDKTDAKLTNMKRKLRIATKTLADCQEQLIQRDRQLSVCKIKTLQIPAK